MKRPALLLLCLAGCGTYTPLDSHYNKGVEFYDDGKLPDAIREYRMAIQDTPSNVRARYNLAVCYHDQGKKDDAAAEYAEVLKLDPDNARALVSLASIRADERKDAEALELLEKAAGADRHSGFPRSCLGAYYERKGEPEKAMEAYQASVAVEPGHAPGHAGIARILAKRGGFADAAEEYDKAVAADGDDVATLIGASEAQEKIGDVKKAMLLLERALVHVKDRAPLWIRLAKYYEVEDRLEDAVAALWEARGVEPANPEVGPRLKALYAKLGAKER
ncbi:MAG TPA: tetratricopeptide repeat protein [Planctomycetota bacterium]|nr:tetratricopeptide repeat protein [Planctomycetota bacterium]